MDIDPSLEALQIVQDLKTSLAILAGEQIAELSLADYPIHPLLPHAFLKLNDQKMFEVYTASEHCLANLFGRDPDEGKRAIDKVQSYHTLKSIPEAATATNRRKGDKRDELNQRVNKLLDGPDREAIMASLIALPLSEASSIITFLDGIGESSVSFTKLSDIDFLLEITTYKDELDIELTGIPRRAPLDREDLRLRRNMKLEQIQDRPMNSDRLISTFCFDPNALKFTNDKIGYFHGDALLLATVTALKVAQFGTDHIKDDPAIDNFINKHPELPDVNAILIQFKNPDFWGEEFIQLPPQEKNKFINRVSNIFARYGGDEFVITKEVTNQKEAMDILKRIQKAFKIIDNHNFTINETDLSHRTLYDNSGKILKDAKGYFNTESELLFPKLQVPGGIILCDGEKTWSFDEATSSFNLIELPYTYEDVTLINLIDLSVKKMKKNKDIMKKRLGDDRKREDLDNHSEKQEV